MSDRRSLTAGLRACGRVVLWSALALVLVRGALTILAPAVSPDAGRTNTIRTRSQFPNPGAVAFAVSFARVYLAHEPGESQAAHMARLRTFLTADLAAGADSFVQGGRAFQVLQTSAAGTAALDPRHAQITVRVDAVGSATRYLTVPVATDANGGLAVFAQPSFSPLPPLAETGGEPVQTIDPQVQAQLEDLLGRFFRIYLGGPSEELTYFAPPGSHLRAVAGRFDRIVLVGITGSGPQSGNRVAVVATVRARTAGATDLLSYRVRLQRQARWYVAAVNADERSDH